MKRRTMFGLSAALVASSLPRATRAQSARLLRFTPASDLSILDPILTSTCITRNHGYMVFDQLYGQDEAFQPQPQMAEGHLIEEDGLRVTIRLRPGLMFHDGEPVRARDAV